MEVTVLLHILAGGVGLLSGYVALYAAKGATVHRKSGMLFVYAMLTMATFGVVLAVSRNKAPEINIPAATLTSYLIITALTTVRPLDAGSWKARWLAIGALLLALGVGSVMLIWGLEAIVNGGKRNGMPAFPFFMFATIGLLGAIGDLRVMRSGPFTGASRLVRHLWRMSIALFLAALSFSVQMASMLARKQIRLPGGVIALPMVLVLVTMLYWLWRVRLRRSLRGIILTGQRSEVRGQSAQLTA